MRNFIRQLIKSIPNLITTASLFLAFTSILFCLQSVSSFRKINFFEDNYIGLAGIFILLSMLFDMLDGFSARLLKVSSPMGMEMDSLSDFVAFVVAPAVLFFVVTLLAGIRPSFYNIPEFLKNEHFFIMKLFAFLFPIAAMYRLSRFNIASKNDWFCGMPSTFAGGMSALLFSFSFLPVQPDLFFLRFISGLTFLKPLTDTAVKLHNTATGLLQNYLLLLFCYFFLTFMMVSHFKFFKLHYFLRPLNRNKKIILLAAITICGLLSYTVTLLFIASFYLVFSLIYGVLVYPKIIKTKLHDTKKTPAESY